MEKQNISQGRKKLSEERIRAFLGTDALPIYIYDEISSTSDAAKAHAQAGGGSAVFIAERQTAGRGRRGRSFSSPEGGGIYMSLLVFPAHRAEEGVLLTTGAAVAMCRAVKDASGITPEIKWVNDMKLGGKKLCGMLTEGEIDPESGRFRYAVIGIGINVRKVPLPPEVAEIATSLDLHAESTVDRDYLAARMILRVLESLSEDRAAQMDIYRSLCPIAGREVAVLRGEERFFAKALSIENDGSLRLLKDGEEMLLSSGEISVRDV
jgi:BirA family biotin operon repressor/biotin-[acetyl-CoA-carboxylase] ligase